MIRVALAHPVRVYRDAVMEVFDRCRGLKAVIAVESVDALVRLISSRRPDVTLLQGSVSDDLLVHCLALPAMRLIAVPTFGDNTPEQLSRRGFAECLDGDACLKEYVRTIESVFENGHGARSDTFDPEHRTSVSAVEIDGDEQRNGVRPGRGLLTIREREVAQLLADGYRNCEIGSELGIQESTVKTHVHHVLRKLGVDRRYRVYAIIDRVRDAPS